jgi:hypothetical protein
MTSSRWTSRWSGLVIAAVLIVGCAFVAINAHLDPMGLFHSKPRIAIYTNERWSKYLLSIRYVPEQFDAVLIGTSVTGNWNTGLLPLRTYNLSIEGGNISEERLLLENVLKRRKPKIVFFCIHPYLTASYGRKSPHMTRRDYWSALGSLELLKTLNAARRHEPEINEFGQQDYVIPARPWKAQPMDAGKWYVVDERSFAEYGQLVATARAAGARVIAVVPPVNEEQWVFTADAYRNYQNRILPFFRSDELAIDFNAPQYLALRGDRANFPDGIHLSTPAADAFVGELARLVDK